MSWRYLDLGDFLLIAEAVLSTPAEKLARIARLDLAESALHAPAAEFGGVEFYPELATLSWPRRPPCCAAASSAIMPCPTATSAWATWPSWS